jgi:hypothetical protein
MERSRTVIPLTLVLAVGFCSALAADSSTFDRMLTHYESIRQALLNDAMEGVTENARQIQHLAQTLESEFSVETAGILTDQTNDFRKLLPSLDKSAGLIVKAASIDEARFSFGKLSKVMAQYRQMTPEPLPVVAYCSMAKEVWLQPKGEIGNHGPLRGNRLRVARFRRIHPTKLDSRTCSDDLPMVDCPTEPRWCAVDSLAVRLLVAGAHTGAIEHDGPVRVKTGR